MSGHSKWSDVRRRLGAPDRARVESIAQRMAFEERLEDIAATQADRLRDALGIPPGLTISFSQEPVPDRDAANDAANPPADGEPPE